MNPKAAVVILNWNGRKLLEEYLPQVLANTQQTEGKVIVADNGSDDDSLELLRTKFTEVEVMAFDKNYGFAEGYNKVCRELNYKYIVLLNSDVAPASGWLAPMTDFLEANPDHAACQPKLLSYREKEKFEYAGAAGGFIDKYGYPFCRGRIFDTCEEDKGQYESEMELDWASGAALCVNRELYLKAGGLDAAFFAHMEEIDLCWRLRRLGKRIGYVPQSIVYHLGGGSLPPSSPRKTYLNFRNNLLMLYKNLPEKHGKKLIFRRMLLDGIAWGMFVAKFNFKAASAVVKAHNDFRKMKKNYSPASESEVSTLRPINIITQYYLKGRKTFDKLPKSLIIILIVISSFFSVSVSASAANPTEISVNEIINYLKSQPETSDSINYSILMPSADEPVVYKIFAQSTSAPGDTLVEFNYLIDWNMSGAGRQSKGFSAYFDGNHYRERDGKISEYHFSENPQSFIPGGRKARGVANVAQFVDIMPKKVADYLTVNKESITVSPSAMKYGRKSVKLSGKEMVNGYVVREFEYYFDPATLQLLGAEFTTSPGQIAEQSISVAYQPIGDAKPLQLSEDALIKLYPEAFALGRKDGYRLANIRGQYLPAFSSVTPGRVRYSRQKGDDFAVPTLFVFLKPGIGSTAALVSDIRNTVSVQNQPVDVIYGYIDGTPDEIEAEIPNLEPGETLLINVRKLAANCGITDCPTILLLSPDGKIKDFLIGTSSDTQSRIAKLINF